MTTETSEDQIEKLGNIWRYLIPDNGEYLRPLKLSDKEARLACRYELSRLMADKLLPSPQPTLPPWTFPPPWVWTIFLGGTGFPETCYLDLDETSKQRLLLQISEDPDEIQKGSEAIVDMHLRIAETENAPPNSFMPMMLSLRALAAIRFLHPYAQLRSRIISRIKYPDPHTLLPGGLVNITPLRFYPPETTPGPAANPEYVKFTPPPFRIKPWERKQLVQLRKEMVVELAQSSEILKEIVQAHRNLLLPSETGLLTSSVLSSSDEDPFTAKVPLWNMGSDRLVDLHVCVDLLHLSLHDINRVAKQLKELRDHYNRALPKEIKKGKNGATGPYEKLRWVALVRTLHWFNGDLPSAKKWMKGRIEGVTPKPKAQDAKPVKSDAGRPAREARVPKPRRAPYNPNSYFGNNKNWKNAPSKLARSLMDS
jgi:hypothetical protein